MLNKHFIMGRLGGDPELKTLKNDTKLVEFSVATKESYKKDGEWQEDTEWHNIKAFGRTAEFIGKAFKKGDLIHIEGKPMTEKWKQNDEPRSKKVVLVKEVIPIKT